MKYLYLIALIFSLGIHSNSFSQGIYNIADEGSFELLCTGDQDNIITDSGGEGGDYGPNETFEITFCLPNAGNIEIVISPELYGNTWDVDENSSFMVYDGNSSAGTLIGAFNSVDDPAGIIATASGACITVVFTSSSTSSGTGFTAIVQCEDLFQPFEVELEADPDFNDFNGGDAIYLCYADSFSVSAITSYPLGEASGNGYEQSDETSFFNWQMGDGTNIQGFGLTEISYAYESGSGYEILLSIIDAQGTIEYSSFYVLQSPRPDFSSVAIDDTLCIGGVTEITGGINIISQDTVGVDEGTGAILGGASIGGQETIVDANENCDSYTIPLIIDDFEDGQVLEDVDDLFNICLNGYHTFVGDLEVGIICPSQEDTLILFDMYVQQATCEGMFPGGFVGAGTDLGEPNENPPIAYDYCWNNEPEFGTFSEEYPAAVGTMPQGSYVPEEDFSELLGCPLNGEWQLVFKDNWPGDVGVFNNWSIYFNPDINPSTEYYSPTIVEAGWDDNPDLTVNEDSTSVTVTPSVEGDNLFTFYSVDEFGCRHDTAINVYVRPYIEFNDANACDLEHLSFPSNSANGGNYVVLEQPNATSNIDFIYGVPFALDTLLANDYGLYTIEYTEVNCNYVDTAVINFRPNPRIIPFPEQLIICEGETIEIDAGPQEDNSDNFTVTWTALDENGQPIQKFDSTGYVIDITQAGTYEILIDGYCADSTDAVLVEDVDIVFEGDSVCGLQASTQVAITPEPGSGVWSANTNEISFSGANQLQTQVSSQNYGTFPITFTDDRCPNDGVTHDFKFIKGPEVNIVPQQPDFCVDLEDLLLTTQITGEANGTIFWKVNDETQTDYINSDSILFEATDVPDPTIAPFYPLTDYEITVFVGADVPCVPGNDTIRFTGKWCTYNIPNVITPNGDGKNERFHIQFIEFFPQTRLTIFDRWGKVVFENDNYDQYQLETSTATMPGGWDPGDNSDGTYYYELLIPYAEVQESGTIQVLRGDGASQ